VLGETYIAGLVVCSEYGYKENKPSPWHASPSRTTSFPFYNNAIKTQTGSATSSQNILPCRSSGRNRRTTSPLQVGSITDWPSLLGHTFILRMHTYLCVCTCIHVHKQIHTHACIHTPYIWRQSVKFPTLWISAPSLRWSEVLLVALPSSEFP